MKTLWPLGQYLNAGICPLPRGSALYIYITLNLGGQFSQISGEAPGSQATVSRKIVVPSWNRRQSHTESPFWPGIGDSSTQNRSSGLGSATVPHRIAVLAWDRRQSHTESPLWPRIGHNPTRNCRSGLGSLPIPHGMRALASGRCSEAPRQSTPEAPLDAPGGSPVSFRTRCSADAPVAGWGV